MMEAMLLSFKFYNISPMHDYYVNRELNEKIEPVLLNPQRPWPQYHEYSDLEDNIELHLSF